METLDHALSAITAVLSIGACLYVWLTSRSKANAPAIDQITDDLVALETRLVKVETSLAVIPEIRKDLGKVFERVNAVSGTTHTIEGQMQQMNQSMTLMLKQLMKEPQ